MDIEKLKKLREEQVSPRKPKITNKFLQERKLDCTNCTKFKLVDGNPRCFGFNLQGKEQSLPANGARSSEKWCGMAGRRFVPIDDGSVKEEPEEEWIPEATSKNGDDNEEEEKTNKKARNGKKKNQKAKVGSGS